VNGRPIKLLYINPTSAMSGAEFSLLALLENLDRRRFTPILLLPKSGLFAKKAAEAGIETVILPSLIHFGEVYRLLKIPKASRAILGLTRIIRKRDIRLIHCNSPRAGYLGGAAARLCSLPSVIHVRDIHLSPFQSLGKARLLGWLSDLIIAVSAATRQSIVKKTPSLVSKVRVVYNGVGLKYIDARPPRDARVELGISSGEPLLAFAGLIHPAKGLDVLLQATAVLKPDFPSLRVLIIGAPLCSTEEDYGRCLKKLASKLGLGGAVVFTGFREDVLDLMSAADILVHPAVYPEPLPRSLLEGLALRKPVVATKVGGIPELIEDGMTGLLVRPSDPVSLAGAVAALLKDPQKALSLGENGRWKVEKEFTIEKHTSILSELYEQLLEPS